MKVWALLFSLLAGCTTAEPPQEPGSGIDMAPICQDGQLVGIVVQTFRPGLYPIQWGAEVCKNHI
jgi:hypothetical protein